MLKQQTPHYRVGKFLANLLSPLTQNEYTVKDSFEAVNMIHEIPPELDQDYRNLSSDVTSFFTNVPLKNGANLWRKASQHQVMKEHFRKADERFLYKNCVFF